MFKSQDLIWLSSIHTMEAFQSLTELKLCGFKSIEELKQLGLAPKDKKPTVQAGDAPVELLPEEQLGVAIQSLPNLRKLEFESCSMLDGTLLPMLPTNLEVLTIIDCHWFDSPMFSEFLSSHGSQLRELNLLHNRALEISFTTSLKSSCPRLEVLRMDLHTISSHRTYDDSAPIYKAILEPDEEPTWPSSLREIEMLYLREWTDAAAINFFESLVRSAAELPNLRFLRVKAILAKMGWRQRISFRSEWTSRLERVFLRPDAPPNPNFYTLAAGRAWLDKQKGMAPAEDVQARDVVALDLVSDSDAPLVNRKAAASPESGSSTPRRKTLRPRRTRAAYSEDSSDGEDGKDESYEDAKEHEPATVDDSAMVTHIQGLCDVVDVTIDNMRPMEKQFTEQDFMDSEPEDDGEWNGREEGDYFDGWQS